MLFYMFCLLNESHVQTQNNSQCILQVLCVYQILIYLLPCTTHCLKPIIEYVYRHKMFRFLPLFPKRPNFDKAVNIANETEYSTNIFRFLCSHLKQDVFQSVPAVEDLMVQSTLDFRDTFAVHANALGTGVGGNTRWPTLY